MFHVKHASKLQTASTSVTASVAVVLYTVTIAAVLLQSPIKSTHIKDAKDDMDFNVSDILLSMPHLVWKDTLMEPKADFLIIVPILLDDSSYIVLIDVDWPERLDFQQFYLNKSLTIDVVFESNKEKVPAMLFKYYKLTVFSVNWDWTSITVHAVVIPNLCFLVILRLLFLKVNKVVIDYEDGIAIDKWNQYNLLNPIKLVAKSLHKFVLMRQKFYQMLQKHKKIVKELKIVYTLQLKWIE